MTLEEQKKRMITGKLYNDLTEELVNARKETVRLTDRYNRTYGEAGSETDIRFYGGECIF